MCRLYKLKRNKEKRAKRSKRSWKKRSERWRWGRRRQRQRLWFSHGSGKCERERSYDWFLRNFKRFFFLLFFWFVVRKWNHDTQRRKNFLSQNTEMNNEYCFNFFVFFSLNFISSFTVMLNFRPLKNVANSNRVLFSSIPLPKCFYLIVRKVKIIWASYIQDIQNLCIVSISKGIFSVQMHEMIIVQKIHAY